MTSEILPGLEGYAKRDRALGQFDTLPEVCAAFVRWCGDVSNLSVLEPCAGIGNLAKALKDAGAIVTANELDPERRVICEERLGHRAFGIDFLAVDIRTPGEGRAVFDLVAENPPYENDGETKFLEQSLRYAWRACAIIRLVGLASERRVDAWERMNVTRVAHLTPRPVFANTSGMDEIVFVEVTRRVGSPGPSNPRMEWITWR